MKAPRKVRSRWAKKFIQGLMRDGNRTRAERIFDVALEMARRKLRGAASPGEILGVSIENARPVIEVVRRRVAGKVYQVPTPVSRTRSVAPRSAGSSRPPTRVRDGRSGQGWPGR